MLYPIVVERGDSEHAYSVVVPDLPGCFSAGDTFDEAMANVREAIAGHLEVLADNGDDIPAASTIESHIDDPDYQGWIWSAIDVDTTPYLGKSQKINVTLPDRVIRKIDAFVASNASYKTRSGFLARAALHELERAN